MRLMVILFFFSLLVFSNSECSSTKSGLTTQTPTLINASKEDNKSENSLPVESTVPSKSKDKIDVSRQLIRKINFNNFKYPWFPKYSNNTIIKTKIVLRNGKNEVNSFPALKYGGPATEIYQESLDNVSYADLTGDGKEEAIVTVRVEFNHWYPSCIFVFAEEKGKAKLLWKYELNTLSSDLEWRGHKVSDGNLIVEEYDVPYDKHQSCCPPKYIRTTFEWDGKTFREKSREIILYDKEKREFTGYPSD